MRAVAITGAGCIGAPGAGLAAQLAALRVGADGLSRSIEPGLPLSGELPIGRVRSALPPLPSRTAALAAAAGREALIAAGLARDQRGDVAVVLGSCTAGIPESERDYFGGGRAESAFPSYRRQQNHRCTAMAASVLGCGGLQSSHSVACASAACAIAEAVELVRSGAVPAALAIGADAITRLTMAGFHSLHLIDPAGCRPLTRGRAGMSLGEGAGALLIESPDHARARGARPIGAILGWGVRNDAYHATTPDPDGIQLERAIADALGDAGLDRGDVGYVSAHGTGTADNDACEALVLSRLFGRVPTASCKRTYGHTMGAAAAIEAVACCLALAEQALFPSAGAQTCDPIDGPEIVRTVRGARLRAACSTTLAFGGTNAALLFGEAGFAA